MLISTTGQRVAMPGSPSMSALTSGELAITNGSGSITKNGINVPADRAAAILSNRAGHYFNVHTALNPDGAIRGQLSEGSFDPGTAVPY